MRHLHRGIVLSLLVTGCGLGDLVNDPPEQVRLDCLVTEIAPDASVSGSLDDDSCTAPRAPQRLANRYRVTAGAGDSLSVTIVSSAFAPRLLVVDGDDFQSPAVVDAADCPRLPGAACVRHHTVAAGGPPGLLVSSAEDDASGSYTLTVARPRAPRPPVELGQYGPDGASPLPAGSELGTTTVVLSGVVSDPDTLEHLRLEVEIRLLSEPFHDQATGSSSPAAAGTPTVRVSGLQRGTSYRWQARTVDETGRATDWIPFGGPDEQLADFRTAAAVARLAFRVQPQTTVAGTAMTPAVEVAALDEAGQVVTGFAGAVTLGLAAAGGASLKGGNPSVQAKDGVAVFSALTIERAGSGYHLEAFAEGGPHGTSDAFDVTPGPATGLVFSVQPTHTAAHRTITPPVRVTALDAFGNVATGFQGQVTLSLGNDPSFGLAHLSGGGGVNAVDGVAVFSNLSIDTPGSGYTLKASGPPGSHESAAFNVTII